MSKGYVYVLTNEYMPGLVKIGKTTRNPEGRANELYQTGVPAPFRVAFEVICPDCGEVEAWVHRDLAPHRVNSSREFFKVDVAAAIRALENSHREQVECWLDEFLPDHSIENPDMCFGEGDVQCLAYEAGESFIDVADALRELTASDLAPALERVRAKQKERRSKICHLKRPVGDGEKAAS